MSPEALCAALPLVCKGLVSCGLVLTWCRLCSLFPLCWRSRARTGRTTLQRCVAQPRKQSVSQQQAELLGSSHGLCLTSRRDVLLLLVQDSILNRVKHLLGGPGGE